jgi:hypothetical protein
MPLLRSRTRVHRARFRFVLGFYSVLAIWTLFFAVVVAAHYLDWW